MAWIWWFYPAVLFYVGISGPALTFMVVIVYEVYLDTGYKWVWLIPLYFISKNMLQLDYPIYGERDPSTFYPAHNVALVTGFFWIFIQHLTRSFQSTTKAITID
ncbi:MAG: hypothetical protein COA73_13045 [Candidatus Hydrogenedentota bacterium]|nr:MAG: hypothetical protein COA73_13045 [Candidatus Hydrogenedentota bacterium]